MDELFDLEEELELTQKSWTKPLNKFVFPA